jgi:hypothetical protein
MTVGKPGPPVTATLNALSPSLRTILNSRHRWPLAITALILISAVFSLTPLVAPAQSGMVPGAALRTPFGYDLLAPVSTIFDALTLLSPAQCWETVGACGFLFVAFRYASAARRGRRFSALTVARGVLNFLGASVAIIGVLLIAPRPMASLALSDPDLIAVDFHSHTSASHDGRPGFTAERNREWHASAGFNVSYVTDHRTFGGVLRGLAANPRTAGAGTVLLPGVELRDADEHPILIGVDPRRMHISSPDWKAAAVEADGGPAPPILLLSLPGDILRLPLDETTGPVRAAGIEIADGSPRGIAQGARDREAIIAVAKRMHFALISASDNHGWGRVAPSWSVLRVPGWRAMNPAQLDVAIRRTIIERGPDAVEVISRRTATPAEGPLGFAGGGVAVAAVMLRTMTPAQRLAWLAWVWGIVLAVEFAALVRRGRRAAAAVTDDAISVEAAA